MVEALIIDRQDNVATAVAHLAAGAEIVATAPDGNHRRLRLTEPIPYGHKLALGDIAAGAEVLKYGEVIGVATRPIPAGAHVHVHNVQSRRARA